MDKEKQAEIIFTQARDFKTRGHKSTHDLKRHDFIRRDEKKAIRDAYIVLGWSFAKIGSVFDRDPRMVKKHVQNTQKIQTERKKVRENRRRHFNELSATALNLAEILDYYYQSQIFTIYPFISSDFPIVHQLGLPTLKEKELSNLMAHLKDEIPEVIPIGEYPSACNQWGTPGDKKWEKEMPSVTITGDLILKLRLRGNQGNFSSRCPDCPR